MAWITPKTDWTTSDGVDFNDFNRIEGDLSFIASNPSGTGLRLAPDGGPVLIGTDNNNLSAVLTAEGDISIRATSANAGNSEIKALNFINNRTSSSVIKAKIAASTDATINTGKLVFYTDDSGSAATAKMTLGGDGTLLLGSTNNNLNVKLISEGEIALRSTSAASGDSIISSLNFVNNRSSSTTIKAKIAAFTDATANTGKLLFYTDSSGSAASLKMTLKGNGHFLVGTATDNATDIAQFNGSIATDEINEYGPGNGVSFPQTIKWKRYYKATTTTAGALFTEITTNWITGTIGSMTITGQMTVGGVKARITGLSVSGGGAVAKIHYTAVNINDSIDTSSGDGTAIADIEIMGNFDQF